MLIIIRGLPGSGKSTLAEHLTHSLNNTNGEFACVFEADQFWAGETHIRDYDGTYWCTDFASKDYQQVLNWMAP
jgi:uridine kinase